MEPQVKGQETVAVYRQISHLQEMIKIAAFPVLFLSYGQIAGNEPTAQVYTTAGSVMQAQHKPRNGSTHRCMNKKEFKGSDCPDNTR